MGVKEPTPQFEKSIGDVDPGGVVNLSWVGWVIRKERSIYNLMILLHVS